MMKAGKTYVYKSKADRKAFIKENYLNSKIDKNSNGEFIIAFIDYYGDAISSSGSRIEASEFKYFKIKENKMLKPDDMINVEMTALVWMKLFPLLGKTEGADELYSQLKTILSVGDEFSHSIAESYCLDWRNSSVLTKAALAQFKDPNQDKINKLEAAIKEFNDEIDKIKAGG